MRARTALLAVAAVLPLAGCASPVVGHGTPGPAVSSAAVSAAADLRQTDPQEFVDSARAAIEQAVAVTVHGDVDAGSGVGPQTVDAEAGRTTDGVRVASLSTTVEGYLIETRAVGKAAWVKAPKAFLVLTGVSAADAAKADGKWIAWPEDETGPFGDESDPTGLAAVLQLDDLGGFGATTTRKVAGRLEIVIDLPGTGRYVLESTAPHRLVGFETGSDARLDISYPDTAPEITAPSPSDVVEIEIH